MAAILAQATHWIVRLADAPLGWLLALPRDLAIVLLAVGTSLLLSLVRKWTTNQDQLRRSRDDLRRLKQLRREARQAGDKAAIARLRATRGLVNALRLKAEGLPLLVSLLPIIFLAVWAVERLDYFPPQVGEDFTLRAYFPLSSVDKLAHLVPPEGAELRGPAVQLVQLDPHGQANGVASWTLCAPRPADSLGIVIRHQGEAATHAVRIGGHTYAPPVTPHEGGRILASEVLLRQAKLLGIVPGIPAIGFPPWLVAYLLIVIPLVPVLRRALRVY